MHHLVHLYILSLLGLKLLDNWNSMVQYISMERFKLFKY